MDLHQLVEWKVPLPVIEVLSTYPEDFPLGRVRAVQQWVDDPLLVVYHHAVPGRVDYWEKARERFEDPGQKDRVRLIIKEGVLGNFDEACVTSYDRTKGMAIVTYGPGFNLEVPIELLESI